MCNLPILNVTRNLRRNIAVIIRGNTIRLIGAVRIYPPFNVGFVLIHLDTLRDKAALTVVSHGSSQFPWGAFHGHTTDARSVLLRIACAGAKRGSD